MFLRLGDLENWPTNRTVKEAGVGCRGKSEGCSGEESEEWSGEELGLPCYMNSVTARAFALNTLAPGSNCPQCRCIFCTQFDPVRTCRRGSLK